MDDPSADSAAIPAPKGSPDGRAIAVQVMPPSVEYEPPDQPTRTMSSGALPASEAEVPVPRIGWLMPLAGEAVSVAWQKPPMSPSSLISWHGPADGLSRPWTAVSSMPLAADDDQWVVPPLSAAVTSYEPKTVAPVPYMTCAASNGSMATLPIHQPNFGVPPQARNGDAEMLSDAVALTDFQVAPPWVGVLCGRVVWCVCWLGGGFPGVFCLQWGPVRLVIN